MDWTRPMAFATPLLDLTQAQALAGEPAGLRALAESFRDSLQTELQQIDAALARDDAQALSFGLHALKGFVPLFCQADLAQAVTALYHDSRHQDGAATAARYRQLAPVLQALGAEVQAWLGAL